MCIPFTDHEIIINLQERMSKAQQNKNYLAKLKTTPKYDEFKRKRTAKMRKHREKEKNVEDEMPLTEFVNVTQKRREAVRERVRKCRERKREKENTQNDTESIASRGSSNLSDLVSVGYGCTQTLGKAVSKVTRAFPTSPTRKKAVLARIISSMAEEEKVELANAIKSPPAKKQYVPNVMINKAIKEFLARDDVSRVSPNARDVKEYLCPDTGNKILLPKRHMVLTMKEAFALFDEEQKRTEKGI